MATPEEQPLKNDPNILDVSKSPPPSKRSNKRKVNLLRLGIGCLAIAFLAMLITVAIAKLMPNTRKSIGTTEKKGDFQEIVFKALLSSNYILGKESQSLVITNTDAITNQLNTKAKGDQIQVINAFFRPRSTSKRMKCENSLSGNILQLNILFFLSGECVNEKENICKIQLQNELKDTFSRMSIIPITIQFDDNHSENITIKICDLMELTVEEEESTAPQRKEEEPTAPQRKEEEPTAPQRKEEKQTAPQRKEEKQTPPQRKEEETVPRRKKMENTTVTIGMGPKLARKYSINDTPRPYALRNSRCSLCINKIGLVQMPGELGTRIQDDIRNNIVFTYDQNRQYLTATVYEESIYRLNVQLDCGEQLDRDSLGSPCSRSLSVTVWIDFNDNEYDDGESRVLRPSWSDNGAPTGAYELDVQIPTIDGRYAKPGTHRMRLSVMPSEEYQRECGSIGYQETRDYTINALRRERPTVPTTTFRPVCPLQFAKIILVLMAGQKGTEIRDDIPKNSLINKDPKQHHMSVTLFEETIYLIRIQLDCSTQSRTDLTPTGCNLAQDVVVSIDLNDDNRFDDSEIASPYRWPVTSYLPEGIYDMQLYVPNIDRRRIRNEPHLMRILVMPSTYYIANCGYSDYSETREYSINIIPRMKYSALVDVPTPKIVSRDFQCVSDVGKILLVVMAGEYRTQIRDDPSTRAAMSRDNEHEEHLTIILYDDTIYLLRIQLECSRQQGRDSFKIDCALPHDVHAWIDLNDDGTFSDTENAAPFRWPITSYIPKGVYDLQLYIPIMDGTKIKSGPHLMRLVVTLDEQYREKCGNSYYTETREYNVTIVRYTNRPDDTGPPYLPLKDNACSQTNGKIVLVLMTGELGTHIRDDTPMNTLVPDNQNRHHLAVTLFENTIYRLRIQLDCDRPSSKGSYDTNCNLAQDVNVWIDLNNDGIYDDAEGRVIHRWPLHTSVGLGMYDFEILIPVIDGQNLRNGIHRMRIVVMPSEEYNIKCGQTAFKEAREYTFNIIPRTTYGGYGGHKEYGVSNDRTAHCSTGNLACSPGHGAIASVKLFGEQNTQIDDARKQCSSTNNYNDRGDLVVTLFDNMVYTLHVELFCAQKWGYENSYQQDSSLSDTSCTHEQYLDIWIDFNSDGIFDENNERISATDRSEDNNRRTQYDLRINIPQIDRRNHLDGQHRMRIVLTQDGQNRKPCYNSGYGEARDYTVQIVSKPDY